MTNQYEQIIYRIYDYLYPITPLAIDELSTALERYGVRSIHEMAIGSGRLALPLSMHGYEVSGVDSSERMLSILTARDVNGQVRARLGDMYDPAPRDVEESYDAVLLMCNGLGIAQTSVDQVKMLQAARTFLKSDGVMFVEMFNPLRYRNTPEQYCTARRLSPSVVLHSSIEIDWIRQQMSTINTIVDSNEIIGVYDERMRFVFPGELAHLADMSGFTLEWLASDWRGSALGSTSSGFAAVLRSD